MDPERLLQRMTQRLELTEPQSVEIRGVIENASPEFEILRQNAREHRAAMRDLQTADAEYDAKIAELAAGKADLAAATTQLRGRVRAEIHAILTPEQQQSLSEISREGRRHGQKNRHRDDSGIG